MATSPVKNIALAWKLLLLVCAGTLAPMGVDAARVYIDSDYSETYNNRNGIRVCDYTPGTGTAYARFVLVDEEQSQRIDSQGNPSCSQLGLVKKVERHRVCQAKPWGDPCSSWVWE